MKIKNKVIFYTITFNFDNWNNGAKGGKLRRIYNRVYWKHGWTPLVIVKWKWLLKKENPSELIQY